MTLKKGILWSQKKMRPQSVRRPSGKYNPVMKQFMDKKGVSEALNLPKERTEFWKLVKSVSKEGVYKKELRKLFGDIRSGKVQTRTISKKEIMKIAKEVFPDSKRRYIFSGSAATEKSDGKYTQVKPNAGKSSSFIRSRSENMPARTTTSQTQGVAAQMTPLKMATIMNRIRESGSDSSGDKNDSPSKGGFSASMAATMKKKK